MNIKISDMLDCSVEILTQEYMTTEQCDPDKIGKTVFERLGFKKERRWKRYIVVSLAAGALCGCVGAKVLLSPGGWLADNQGIFEKEIGLIEGEFGNDTQNAVESDLIDEQYLYIEGNVIAKYVIELDTEFDEDELYVENGTMLIFHDNGEGVEIINNTELKLRIEQQNVNGNPGTVEVGYIANGKPHCIQRITEYKTAVKIEGKEGEVYYPYLKNISSDRLIIKIKYERE
jgi:hypothetical protein